MPVSRRHKLVLLGGERVGKTAIVEQFIFGNHVVGQGDLPTLGDIYETTVETEKGPTEKLQIFDTSGTLFTDGGNEYEQEHFLAIADGFILVYEITSKSSFDLIVSLRQRIASKNKDAAIVVLGNKKDLNAIREVECSKASHWCQTHAVKFYEVTVLDREGLKEPLCYVAWRMANPGRPFPPLPSLPTSLAKQHPPFSTDSSFDSCSGEPERERSLKPVESATSKHEESLLSSEACDDSSTSSLRSFPDDATFPRHSTASFLFTDCLSSKSKKYKDGF